MSTAWLKGGLIAAFAMFASAPAWGHGGNYKGPSDTVPPNLGGGGDTTPPGNPGGPGTPGPGAPTTGGGKGPTTGGVPTAPGAGGGAGMRPTTGGLGGRKGSSEGFERWEFWWEHNKDPFLDLKARLGKGAVTSGTGGFLTGRAKATEAVSANRPTAADVKERLLPAFVEALNTESHPDIVDSSALAIGRTLRPEDAGNALEALTKALGHNEKTGREAATLAMGVLGAPEAVEILRGILNDTPDGRRATNHPQGVEPMVRSFAAASLGMIGDKRVIEDLKKVITDPNLASQLGVKAMSILALGMMKNESHSEIVPFLLGLMEDRSLNAIVRAQAPIALGRLNRQTEDGSVEARQVLKPKILPLFEDDKADNDLRRSLAICIGMLSTVEDGNSIDALLNYITKGNDDQTRHYSIMALAEIGSRDAEPDKHEDVHAKLREFFVRELTQPKKITHQGYGALGLAVYSRNMPQERKNDAAMKLLDAFNSTSNPSYQGAMAIGLGLLDYRTAAEDLWKKFEDSNDQQLKGYIAVSLGLMRVTKNVETLRALISKKGLEHKFRLQLARSLGLMSDTQAVPTLIDYLQTAETLTETASAAQALGLIGDKSATDPLLAILRNKSKQPTARGFAAVALGLLAEKTSLPWNAVFSVDSNYRAKVDALSEILDIL